MSKVADDNNGNVLRKAGLLERFHITRVAYGLDTGVIVSAKYTHPTGHLDKETLFPALRVLVQKDRALSVQIRDSSSKNPLFVGLDSVDLGRIVHFHSENSEHLQSVYESYLVKPFEEDTKDPLWRLAVLSDNNVLFMFHHAVGDGQSGLAFHNQLLSTLNAFSGDGSPTGDTSPIVDIPSSLVFAPPVEQKMDMSVGLPVLLRAVRDTFVPVKFRKAHQAWSGKDVTKDKSLTTHVRLLELSPADAEALLRICRKHKTTLTAFFHTLGVVVLGDLIRTKVDPSCKFVATDLAISLRRFTGTPSDVICDEVSGWSMIQRLGSKSASTQADDKNVQSVVDDFPWERARKFASDTQKNLPQIAQMAGCLKFLFGDFEGFYNRKLDTKRASAFSLSNLGRFPSPSPPDSLAVNADKSTQLKDSGNGSTPEGERWHIDSMFFTLCDAVVGGAMKLCVSTAESGTIGLTFSWGLNALDDDFADEFVQRYHAIAKATVDSDGKE